MQREPRKIQQDIERATRAGQAAADARLLTRPTPARCGPATGRCSTEPILVVNQKAKLIEINNEYAIYDQNARQIGAVREVGQSDLKKAVRLLSSLRPVPDPQAAGRRHGRQRRCSP